MWWRRWRGGFPQGVAHAAKSTTRTRAGQAPPNAAGTKNAVVHSLHSCGIPGRTDSSGRARGTGGARSSGIGKGAGAAAGHKGRFARCARTGKNLPQTGGGRMQQLCYKCARDVRLARAAEGGRLSPQGGRSTSGQKDLRTKGRAPIAEGTRCRAAKRRASDRRGSGAWRGAHPATEVTRNPRCRFSRSAGGGVLADLPCFGRAPALEHRREHVEPFLGEGLVVVFRMGTPVCAFGL